MPLEFHPEVPNELKPRIVVIGVGGAGGNAVNNMIASRLDGVEFIAANTDAQAISQSLTQRRIQLGVVATRGLGAGAKPQVGREAAEESLEEIIRHLAGANMAFITAGMGGGTGSGAAPVIARAAREQGILTVGVVTKPFQFEAAHRMRLAEAAIEELSQYVDTLIVIPNQNLFRVVTERTSFAAAFKMADDVLYSGVRGVTDLIMMPGIVNLDFADIRTVMTEMGKAMMGTGEAEGEKRAIEAAEAAISNPLLDDTSMRGARSVLINITAGDDLTLFEVDEAINRIRDEVDPDVNLIFGSALDENINGRMRVSVVATGIASETARQQKPTVISLVNTPSSTATSHQVASVTVAHPTTQSQTAVPSASSGLTRPSEMAPTAERAPLRAPGVEGLRPDPEMRQGPSMDDLSDAVSDIARPRPAPAARQREPEQPAPKSKLWDLVVRRNPPSNAAAPKEPRLATPVAEPVVSRPAAAPQTLPTTPPVRSEPAGNRTSDDMDIPAFLRRQAN